jgi:hypothetical protein
MIFPIPSGLIFRIMPTRISIAKPFNHAYAAHAGDVRQDEAAHRIGAGPR